MGKKGSWFAAIKKVFVSHSKDKPVNDSEEKKDKRKNKGGPGGKLKHGERKSFIPLFREPSSIEKILGDAEREHNIIFRPPETSPPLVVEPPPPRTLSFVPPPLPVPPREPPPRPASPRDPSPRAASPRAPSPRASSPRGPSPRVASPRAPPPPQRAANHQREFRYHPEPTLRNQIASATKIQAAYRGYMARRSFRALRGLVRLQGVVRGHNVKRQTMNAMKYMQLLVRVQSQIQSRRIQMLENQARQQQQRHKEFDTNLGKWSLAASDAGYNEDWDDSLLTKEEVDARLQRKIDAVAKRERAMAYAYSHQQWSSNPKSAQTPLMKGYPLWWNWIERQLPQSSTTEPPQVQQTPKNYRFTPPRSNAELKPSPRPASSTATNKQPSFRFDNTDPSATPRSTRSLLRTPPSSRVVPPSVGPSEGSNRYYPRVRAAAGGESPFGMKDDDSLISCPPFSVPNYMAPTVSAKAKARANSNPRDRFPGTPNTESSRRSSFPLTPSGIGSSFKWNKGSFFSRGSGTDPSSKRGGKAALDASGDLISVDSTTSLPAGAIGRKPFNRFV